MDPKSPGLRRYLYEHVFYRAIQQVQRQTKQTVLVSTARMLRGRLDADLIAGGVEGGIGNPNLGVSRLLTSVEKVLSGQGHGGLFSDATHTNELYRRAFVEFHDITGLRRVHQGRIVEPEPGVRGPSLPISPYDPRWSTRHVVKKEGSRQLYAPLELVDAMSGFTHGRVDRLHNVRDRNFSLYRYDELSKNLAKAGRAYSDDDATGMSELMSRMSEAEYRKARNWVIRGTRNEKGYVDPDRCMSPQALSRSVAILDELRNQGVEYRIEPDRYRGQLKAVIESTKIEVRITDIRAKEHYIGRVYDNGVATTYSTNYKPMGQNATAHYVPTPEEAVELLRFAQGKSVRRGDNGWVGQLGGHDVGRSTKPHEIPNSYFSESDNAAMFVAKQAEVRGRKIPGAFVYIRQDAFNRTAASTWFGNTEKAAEFLHQAVTSARKNMHASLNADGLITEYKANAEAAIDGEYFPDFDGDPEIAAVQRSYWDVLRGAQSTLLRPGITEEEYRARVEILGELTMEGQASRAAHEKLVAQLSYTGTPEQKVRDHAQNAPDGFIGTFELREVNDVGGLMRRERFNPGRVAARMASEYGQFRNQADIVAALRVVGIPGNELMGDSFHTRSVRDRLISFDPASAVPAQKVQDPFIRRMLKVTAEAIERKGGRITSLQVDGNGIIRYTVDRYRQNGTELRPAVGEIGQIFSPGQHGEVVTRFASGDNYMFVPGYEARVLPQKLGEQKSVEERTVLRGYEQTMAERIEHRIASDMMTMRTRIGDPSSLNGVYRALYDTRHEVDFITRAQEQGLSRQWVESILATEARRVRYPSSLASGSTMHAEWNAKNDPGWDPSNDNFDAPLIRTGRNMVVLSEEGSGFFDPDMTGNSVNQGIVRYLTADARVEQDGTIAVGAKGGRTPLASMAQLTAMQHNPWDRRQMTLVNLLNASAITDKEGSALMTFGGWGLDDPVVVSKEFAEKYRIRGADGLMRPLIPGDKISDLHGNKGVISLTVDRDALPGVDFDADDSSLVRAHRVFADNPALHVIMPPFSAVSRFNGGTAREMMEDPQDLRLLDKGMVPGAVGHARYIITGKTADKGTRVYDQQDQTEGRGRRASAQLAWALSAQECSNVMAEIYGPNTAAASNLREMLVAVGLDIEPDGTLRIGYDDLTEGSARRLFAMPELIRTAKGTLNWKQMREDFGAQIGNKGGEMELPFPLQMPTGATVPKVSETSWGLPVMSAHLRSGQDLGDGVRTTHDYTRYYLAIFKEACRYRHAMERLADEKDPKKANHLERMVQEAPRRAQGTYAVLTEDLKRRRFSGKRNFFRENVMSISLPNSATAVWTCDPRLDIDQVAMGPAMAEALGLSEDDHAMIWRDPVLRDGGVRYMRVAIDERLTGVAINPVMDKSFDGDFDGDSVGVFRLTTKAAKAEALERLTVEANLLELGSLDEDGFYQLAMQNALDVKVSQHMRPELAAVFAELKREANNNYADLTEGTIDRASFLKRNRELVRGLSEYYREALEDQYGDAVLRFDSTEAHMRSVLKACIEPGAKGSVAKLRDYSRYLGVDPDTFADLGRPQHTREDDHGVMIATAVKSHGTGVAGMYSQRGVKALRGEELQAVLELTYPVTQSILQSKHDPEEALHKYNMIMGPVRALWKGLRVEKRQSDHGSGSWEVAREENGIEAQATTQEWVETFLQMYTSKEGLNVAINPAHVEAVAHALTDPTTGRMTSPEDQGQNSERRGSTLDRLAYGGEFEDLVEAAKANSNLFAGERSSWFTPYLVTKNQKAVGQAEEGFNRPGDVRALGNKDTQLRPGEKAQVATGAPAVQTTQERKSWRGSDQMRSKHVPPYQHVGRQSNSHTGQDVPEGFVPAKFRTQQRPEEYEGRQSP
ncbi:hypothetical protein [Nocardiopsis synnemataformans]|uniref:hypothetical protein n=1 Tax=Nocardiopsis synnemataformans TaxID=61305 RepID=UPI003EBBE4F7